MATIKDVARVAGVSTATVSRVIHGGQDVSKENLKKVTKVIAQLGYRPNSTARALVSKKATTIGLVTPRVSMSFFGTLASGVEKAARDKNLKLLVSNSMYETQSELDAIESLRDHNCTSIILHSEYSDEKTLIQLAKDIPGLVLINRYISEIAERCVWLDNVLGAKRATEHLLNLGHRDFAVVTSVYQNGDPEFRLQGIKERLHQANISLPKSAVAAAKANIEGGERAVDILIESGQKFTALLAYNDLMAIGAIHRLFEHGLRVPEDVSVVGFDDLSYCMACRPRLTTMHYPVEEMAIYASELSINLAEGKHKANRTHLFVPELVVRGSTGKPVSS